MTRPLRLRMTGQQHEELRALLLPGDGLEAVAIGLCGRHSTTTHEYLLLQEVHPVPAAHYLERHPDRVRWTTDWMLPLLERADRQRLGVLKVHSHPTGFRQFSRTDNRADEALFPSLHGWTQDVPMHGSAIVLPDGYMIARGVLDDGSFVPADRVMVAGDVVRIFDIPESKEMALWSSRHAQALGKGTTALLGRLRIGVVGCSGTGSFAVEMLARLGVGELVLVDPDTVAEENLNRIIWAGRHDVGRPKVDVARDHVLAMGLGSTVVAIAHDLAHVETVTALASCDVVVGCMDSHDGRRLLNRIATFYLIPYVDVGVRLDADGHGGLDHVSGAVHYLQPGRSSLLSRGVVDHGTADAEAWHRADAAGYAERRDEGYIRGVGETRPAVVSINGMFSAMAVNELLARLHGFRWDNASYAEQRFVLHDPYYDPMPEGDPCASLRRHVGRGDTTPLLDMPELG